MLPLAVVVTPGTLTVQTSYQTSYELGKPPQLNLDANKYAVYAIADNDESPENLQGPVRAVTASTVASMAQQIILPIAHAQPNVSYHLQFNGPAIQCIEPPESNRTAFRKALLDATELDYFAGTSLGDDTAGGSSLVYNAWAPDESNHKDLSNPNWNNGSSNTIDSTYFLYPGGTLFVHIGQVKDDGYGTITLLQCMLYNATYDVDFNFSGSDQEVKLTGVEYHGASPVSLQILGEGYIPSYEELSNPNVTYTSIMWAFNQVLVGTGTTNPAWGQDVPNYTGTLAQITALRAFIEENKVLEFNTVKATIEQMFQNTTLSLLNSDRFL